MRFLSDILYGIVFTCLVLVIVAVVAITSPFWLGYRRWKYWGAPSSCCRSGCTPCPWGNRKYRHQQPKILSDIAHEAKEGETRFRCYKRNCSIATTSFDGHAIEEWS